jgi:hypothetical protein
VIARPTFCPADTITLLPHPEGMRFDIAQVFNITYGKIIHMLLQTKVSTNKKITAQACFSGFGQLNCHFLNFPKQFIILNLSAIKIKQNQCLYHNY